MLGFPGGDKVGLGKDGAKAFEEPQGDGGDDLGGSRPGDSPVFRLVPLEAIIGRAYLSQDGGCRNELVWFRSSGTGKIAGKEGFGDV